MSKSGDKVVYAVVSFPRKDKTNFHYKLISPPEQKHFRDTYKIIPDYALDNLNGKSNTLE